MQAPPQQKLKHQYHQSEKQVSITVLHGLIRNIIVNVIITERAAVALPRSYGEPIAKEKCT